MSFSLVLGFWGGSNLRPRAGLLGGIEPETPGWAFGGVGPGARGSRGRKPGAPPPRPGGGVGGGGAGGPGGRGPQTPPPPPKAPKIFLGASGSMVLHDPAAFSVQFVSCAPARHSFHGVNPVAPPGIYFTAFHRAGGRAQAGRAAGQAAGRGQGGKGERGGGGRKNGKAERRGPSHPCPRSSARQFKSGAYRRLYN
jgi:hypothetical protein